MDSKDLSKGIWPVDVIFGCSWVHLVDSMVGLGCRGGIVSDFFIWELFLPYQDGLGGGVGFFGVLYFFRGVGAFRPLLSLS